MPDFLSPPRASPNPAAGHGGLVVAGVTLGLALAAGGIALAGSDRPTSTSATDVSEIAWGEGQVAGTPSVAADAAADEEDVSGLPERASGDVVGANVVDAATAQAVSGAQAPGWPVSSAARRSAAVPLTLSVSWAGAPAQAAAPDVAPPPAVVGVEAKKPRKPAVTAPPVQSVPAPEVVLASGEGVGPGVPAVPAPAAPAPVAPVPVVEVPVVEVPVVEVPVVEVPVVEAPAEEVPVVEEPSTEPEPETGPEAPGVCEVPPADPEVGDVSVEPVVADGCEVAPEEEAPGEEKPGEENPGEETSTEQPVATPVTDVEVPVEDADEDGDEVADEAVAAQEVVVVQA